MGQTIVQYPPANSVEKPRHQRRNSWEDAPKIPAINCRILNIPVKGALCDLGASINIMPTTIYQKIDWVLPLTPTDIQVQLADSTIRQPKGKLYHIPVSIRSQVVFTDFIILTRKATLRCRLFLGDHS